MILKSLRIRRRSERSERRVLPPSARATLLEDTARRQILLATCDRSPALLRLDAPESSDVVTAWLHGAVEVGELRPPIATDFRRLVAKTRSRGQELWVHGQVERRDVELCVVLHCPLPTEL